MASFLARVGRFSFVHRWPVLIAWLLIVAAAATGAFASGIRVADSFSIPGTESDRVQQLLEERFGAAASGVGSGTGASAAADAEAPASSRIVVVAPPGQNLITGGGIPTVLAAAAPIGGLAGVATVSDPTVTQTIAPDGSALYLDVQFAVPTEDVPAATEDALLSFESRLESAGYTVALSGGPFSTPLEILSPRESIGVVVALVVLVVTFGSLLAAGMPILTALLGVGVGVGGVLALSAVIDVSSATLTLGLMLGLAVGIDYALFLVSRHRQQLADGIEPEESAALSVATAGSAVVFAGSTVVVALVGLLVTGIPFLGVMGVAAAATVAIAVLIAITLLPALMGFAGTRLTPRGRALVRAKRFLTSDNRWGRLVTRYPVRTLLTSLAVLLVVAIPMLSMRLGLPDAAQEPEGSRDREAYELLAQHFGPGINGPLVLVVDAAAQPASLLPAAGQLSAQVGGLSGVAYVSQPIPNPAGNTALLLVLPTTGPNDEGTTELVHAIRDVAEPLGAATGTEIGVTGAAAATIDISDKLADALPVFLAIIVGLALLLLLIAFRSILVPITAVLGFLLTIGAAFGATVAVYQWGWLADVFGVATPAPLLSFMPVLMVGVLFGLAMDYQVFIVSRMREEHVHGAGSPASVQYGFAHGARVVTAAALIMVAVFAGFVFSGSTVIGPIAFAMGLGILIDAFVVRMTMIPAVMALLGEKAWWLPRRLDRIVPNVDIEGASLERPPTPKIDEPASV